MAGDLHTHTTWSDGALPASLLPKLAARAGLDWLAITDHDSLLPVEYACEHPAAEGVSLIPATELTAYDFDRGRQVHILCYWPDKDCPELAAHCHTMAARRNAVCTQSAKELEEIYPQFRLEDARRLADAGGGVLFKSTLMRVLYEYGLADGIYQQDYKALFGKKGGRVLHDPEYEPVDKVLAVIKAARGVAVFAHPSVYNSMELVAELAAAGRIDGVEIEHPRNTPEDKEILRRLAGEYGLVTTGGTDFHGLHAGKTRPLGTCRATDEEIGRLNALAREKKKQGEKNSK